MLFRPKKRNDQFNNPRVMFNDEAEEERYKRYKHACYRNLVLKALLSFSLGLLLMFLFKCA